MTTLFLSLFLRSDRLKVYTSLNTETSTSLSSYPNTCIEISFCFSNLSVSFRLVGKLIPSQLYSSACSLIFSLIVANLFYRMKVSCYTPFEAVDTILVLWISNCSLTSQIFGDRNKPSCCQWIIFCGTNF